MSKKVCLLIDSLSSGGAEKMVANLSKSLTNKNYHVIIVTMLDSIVYDYNAELFNFGKLKSKHNKFKSFLEFKAYFKTQKFDCVLDHRIRNNWLKEFLFSKLIFRNNYVIYCVHHSDLSMYFPKVNIPFLTKLTLVKNRDIVAVSKLAKAKIQKQLNLKSQVIYNYPLNLKTDSINNPKFEFIIAVGRLTKIKQFDVLIDCYNNSLLPDTNIKLLIFGEGVEQQNLQNQIVKLGLEDKVILKGFSTQILSYVNKSKALVMSSMSEGFPMVLIEAIQQKTPVISFDCESGPNEIIIPNKNGILVKDQDKTELTKALNKLIDKDYYSSLCKSLETYDSPFTEKNSINKWIALIETN